MSQDLTEAARAVSERLQKIAKRNGDKFEFTCTIALQPDGLLYEFVAAEDADGHEFVTGKGPTAEAAIVQAAERIESACKYWHYKVV